MSTTSLASNRPTVERRHRYDREYYLTHKTLWAEKGRRWEERCAADPSCRSRRAERHRQSKARHKGRNVERRRIQQKAANQRRRARIVQTVPLEERRRIAAARKKAVYDNKRGVIKALRRASVCSVCGGPCQHFHHLQPAEKAPGTAKLVLVRGGFDAPSTGAGNENALRSSSRSSPCGVRRRDAGVGLSAHADEEAE